MNENIRLIQALDELKSHGIIADYVQAAKELGTNKAGISDIKAGRKKISVELLGRMKKSYPQINIEWVITGQGEMIKVSGDIIASGENSTVNIGGTRTEGNRTTTANHYYAAQEGCPPQEQVCRDKDDEETKPFYDIDFSGGFDEIFNDQQAVPDGYIRVPGFERADCWCRLRGDSMSPEIKSGELIALRECPPSSIIYGNIYAVVMNDLRTVKQLRKAKSNEHLRFIPINSDRYDEQEFHKSEIIRIFEVLGSIRKFF